MWISEISKVLVIVTTVTGVALSIILHKRRLEWILKIDDPIELSKSKYMRQQFLTIANFLISLAIIF